MGERWESERVLVTEGSSFVGGHLVEDLVTEAAKVRVASNDDELLHER